MEAVAILVVLASIGAGLFGLVNLIKPLGWFRLTSRRYAAALVVASFFAFMVGGLMGAASQPGGLSAAMEAEAESSTASAPTKDEHTEKAAPAGVTQAEFDSLWARIKIAMEPCDAQVGRAGEAMSGGNAYAAYPLVIRAKDVCWSASSAISDLDLPRSAKGDARKALDEGRDACSMAMFLKRQAMDKVAKVVDGDSRPSAVAAAQSEMEDAGRQTMACVIGMGRAAEASDLVLPEIVEAAAAPDAPR